MKILSSPSETQAFLRNISRAGRTIGLVPTMGCLHNGHLSLVRRARAENDFVVASIFVNPTQFGPSEDLAAYPRNIGRDTALLEAEGADLLFCPQSSDMYLQGFSTSVAVSDVSERLCGEFRPGHFTGVATVVCKLFNIAGADKAYFGAKDYQQTVVIRRMARDLNIGTEIIICPTVREADGLAMSSRNSYLAPDERKAATVLYRALSAARNAAENGERNAGNLVLLMREIIGAEPLATIEYAEAADADTLGPIGSIGEIAGPVVLALAARIGKTRLIDNLVV
ncbi:MAG: pantoate--beta-alanine ligase [Nitrospirae bacterium]|nr:pantoate--beta-alanine ligase [Nitrospirota bacterium]